MIYDRSAGLSAIMFPVKEMKVFADLGFGQRSAPAPAYKALLNAESGQVISIVGSRYQVLHNSEALQLARIACACAFPGTQPDEWVPKSIEAALNGGSCAVDLSHERLRLDWELAPGVKDLFTPFVRFRNGYNGRTAFSLFFGFERMACSNGLVHEERIAGIKVSHDARDIAEEIERRIQKAEFHRVPRTIRERLTRLWGHPVPRRLFSPIAHLVLRIRPPDRAGHRERRQIWSELQSVIELVTEEYVKEFGPTAYALMNVISDLATHLPSHHRFVRHGFVPRSRHSLQVLVALWLRGFSIRVAETSFDLDEYVKNLSKELATAEWRGYG